MAVELLVSPAASGKTEACIQRIRALLLERPFAPVRVVLPDRLQAAAFRRRLARAGGAIGVPVGTFGDLYSELLELAGQPYPVASPPMVHRLVQAAIQAVDQAGGLQHYAGLKETPGFVLALKDAFAELKRALVRPELFSPQVASGSPAQQELARLYQAYQDRLHALNWADPEGLSWLAVEVLGQDPDLANRLALLVVDGFDSFSGAQRQALRLLAPGGDILITLPGAPPFTGAAQRRFESAFAALKDSLPFSMPELPPRSFLPAALQHVEASLFESGAEPASPGEQLYLIEARSPAEEAREALRWLKSRVVRHGVPLQACGVVTPDPQLYHAFLRQAAQEFGMPLRFTQGETLAQAPAVAALLELLNLPALNYPRRPLLDTLRSPYFDLSPYGLDGGSVDVLDEVSRYGQVIEGRQQWDEVLARLALAPAALEIEGEDGLRLPGLPGGEQASGLQRALQRFFARLDLPGEALPLVEWVRWLEDLLDDWGYYQTTARHGNGEADEVAFEQLRETLRALVLGEALTGPQLVGYARFAAELRGALEGVGFQVQPAGGLPAALVMHMLEARGVRFQALAILGLAEGIFPTLERADPFLDEALRQALGLESRLQRQQPGLFYQAVTRADRFLLLTRPYLADDGEKWEASPYWKALLALLPEGAAQTIRPDDPRPLCEAASAEEALFWAVRRRGLPQSFADLQPRWEYLRHAARLLSARQAEQAAGPYEGFAAPLADLLGSRYPADHLWSPSRLESYGICPFNFFINSALEIEARAEPELGLDAAQLGTLLHAILEQAYAGAPDPADPGSVLDVLEGIARQVFTEAPQKLGFRPSPLWQAEQQQLLQVLRATVQRLAELDAGAGWRPLAFELPFGLQGAPPLVLQVGGQAVLLRGLVDRVDRAPDGRLRIIDYKTGSSHLSKKDLALGRRLQLPLYALAVQAMPGMGEVTEGLYWALLSGKAGELKLSAFRAESSAAAQEDDALEGNAAGGPQAAIDTALQHLGRIVPGIRQAHFPPTPPRGGCPGYCPASTWCWRYSPGWRP